MCDCGGAEHPLPVPPDPRADIMFSFAAYALGWSVEFFFYRTEQGN